MRARHVHSQAKDASPNFDGVEVALAMVLVDRSGTAGNKPAATLSDWLGFDPNGLINISFNMDKQPLEGLCVDPCYIKPWAIGLRHLPGVERELGMSSR